MLNKLLGLGRFSRSNTSTWQPALISALQHGSSRIMIADAEFRLKFISEKAQRFMVRMAPYLRERIGRDFDPARLLEKSIDVFHANPQHQRQVLQALQPGEVHSASLRLGEHQLEIRAWVIPDERNPEHVVAYIIEWFEVTFSEGFSQASEVLQGIASGLNESVPLTDRAMNLSQDTVKLLEAVSAELSQAASYMQDVRSQSDAVSRIIDTIDGISTQIKLLSLNASVEAARAGEYGRGFSVLATEVARLAQQSSQASRQINDILHRTMRQIADGTDYVSQANEDQAKLIEGMSKIDQLIERVAQNSKGQSDEVFQLCQRVDVLRNLEQVDESKP